MREKEDELLELRCENDRLSKEVNEVQTDYRVVNDDYKALIQIMDRARRLAFYPKKKKSLRPGSKWMLTEIWNGLSSENEDKSNIVVMCPPDLREIAAGMTGFSCVYLFYYRRRSFAGNHIRGVRDDESRGIQ